MNHFIKCFEKNNRAHRNSQLGVAWLMKLQVFNILLIFGWKKKKMPQWGTLICEHVLTRKTPYKAVAREKHQQLQY